jgi:PAS domain-containing protein
MITTVYHSAEARRDGFRAGADEYLIDPVEPQRLVAAIARHLDPPPGAAHAELPTVITDVSGRIVMTNAAAARLLNLSRRGLRTRSLLAFFAPGRDRVATQMSEALSGRVVQGVATIRPRDLKPFAVRLDISAVSWEQGGSLEWVLEPVHGTQRASAGVDHAETGSADARPDGQRYATSTSAREVQSWTALADGGGTISSSAGAPNARSNKHDRRQPQDDHRPGQSDAPTEQDAA